MDEQVTLTGYADQVRELIRNDRNNEAIALCKHILRYYPKYVGAYRQLGEALLEKGHLDDAKDLFRRVLSADPESVVAYAGLAVILEQEHLVAEAAWHMERAFELAPSNTELHKELHRLYHELDGRPRARLDLTPVALARQYVKEGLYAQAIQELNTVIAESGARFDARVALAETLWRAGQMRQAAEVAQALLEPLPYCLKANLILGAAWKETGLAESDQYLQRAQSIDPTNQTAQNLFGARSPLPLTLARVPRFIEGAPLAPPVGELAPATEIPSAAELIQIPAEPIAESAIFGMPLNPPTMDTALPPWLRTPEPEVVGTPTTSPQAVEPAVESPAEPTAELKPAEEPQPDATPQASGDIPAWLAQLRQSAESASEPTEEAPVEPAEDTSGALPPWLRAEEQSQETTHPSPIWIEEAKLAEAADVPPISKEEPTPEAEPALPPWIAAESHTEETVPTTPAWIEEAKLTEAIETLRALKEEPQPEPTASVPAWVALLSHAGEPAPAEPKPQEQELPVWMRQAAPATPAPVEETAPAQTETAPRMEELPPWLGHPTPPPEPAATSPTATPVQAPAPAPKRKSPTRGDSHLILARTYRDANQLKEALVEYDYVVQKAPRLVNQVIGDLQVLSKRSDVPLDVHRILGDAYTRADRLSEALEEYRFVLGRVASG